MSLRLNLLCAGAVQGLVKAVQDGFEAATGAEIVGRFGAVGGLKEALVAGEPCDLMIVTAAMVDSMVAGGHLQAGSQATIGRVRTGIAVPRGSARPDVSTAQALQAALRGSDPIFFPDPERATAGIHFAGVMQQLGLLDVLRPRFRTFPSGAIAMREMAVAAVPRSIGCTQVTEILYTDGVELAGLLPPQFELSTAYTAAVGAHAAEPALAARLIALLVSDDLRDLRRAGGFEP